MLQSLLADRFNLRAHFEERQTQVYALVREGKVDKLTPIKPCSADMTQASAATSTLV